MSQQDEIEKGVRMTIGDLTLQLIVTRAQVTDQAAQIAALEAKLEALAPEPPPAVNGKDRPTTAPKEKPN